jgi:hypothetical protein
MQPTSFQLPQRLASPAAAAKRGRWRGRHERHSGDVRMAFESGASRTGVRRPVRHARVGVPRLPLRIFHHVRQSPSSPPPHPLPAMNHVKVRSLGEPIRFVYSNAAFRQLQSKSMRC